MTASPAPSLLRQLPGAGIVVVLATAIYWLLRQDHLYLDGSIALGFLSEEGDVPSYWGYFFLARLFVRCVSPLGLTPHEAGCLFSGVMAALAAGMSYVTLGVLGIRARTAALITALVVLAPCQIYYATTLEKRTVTEFGAALVLLCAVLVRHRASWPSYAAFLLVVAGAVHIHYNVAAACVPAFMWLCCGPADQGPFRLRAAAGAALVAAASLLLVPSLFLPFAEHSYFLTYFGGELAATPVLLHLEYLLHLAVDLAASLGLFLVFAWLARRDARLRWVLAGCLPMVLVHWYGMELNDRRQVPYPDIPDTRGAYLLVLLPALACVSALVLKRSLRPWTWAVVAALGFNAVVLGLWFADRGESVPATIREVRAILRRFPRSPVTPTVLVRSRNHEIVASATTPAAESFAALALLPLVTGLDDAARAAAAAEWNRGCRELLAGGGTVLVCPRVMADLERAGARDFVDALLNGVVQRPVPDAPSSEYALLALR